MIPDLNGIELQFWQADQAINRRGVRIDIELVYACIEIIEEAYVEYNKELAQLTGGAVTSASQVKRLSDWMESQCVITTSLSAGFVDDLLKRDLPHPVRRALEIRKAIGSAAVKKLYAMWHMYNRDDRVCDNFIYHAARTGRTAGSGLQVQNFPSGGPTIEGKEWSPELAEAALKLIATEDFHTLEHIYGKGKTLEVISGCLRGLLIAAPGKMLVGSDYSAIEAVVLAQLAQEQWRIDIFKSHGKIYEASAAKISGTSLEEILKYKDDHGKHHPLRKLGKTAELASGYGGGVASWKVFWC